MRGAWIEIRRHIRRDWLNYGRSPCGERGLKYQPARHKVVSLLSLPVRGAWIEIDYKRIKPLARYCRSPCGERGLKSLPWAGWQGLRWSLPVRGAWIEISGMPLTMRSKSSLPVRGAWIEIQRSQPRAAACRRSPCGERGLKCTQVGGVCDLLSRSPCGERGLKCLPAPS